ncbi:MAG: hypothetical protein AAFX53_05310 [Bacteroidota bacterium]
MKHSDIDTLFKQGLQHAVADPDKEVWNKLQDQLYEGEEKIERKRIRLKTAIFLFMLLMGTGLIQDQAKVNGEALHAKTHFYGKSNKTDVRDLPAEAQPPSHKVLISKTIFKKGENLYGKVPKTKSEPSSSQRTPSQFAGSKIDSAVQMPVTHSANEGVDSIEDEIEDLMIRARINVNLERALERKRKEAAHKLLVELEKQKGTHGGLDKAYEKVKQGFKKLKSTIAN